MTLEDRKGSDELRKWLAHSGSLKIAGERQRIGEQSAHNSQDQSKKTEPKKAESLKVESQNTENIIKLLFDGYGRYLSFFESDIVMNLRLADTFSLKSLCLQSIFNNLKLCEPAYVLPVIDFATINSSEYLYERAFSMLENKSSFEWLLTNFHSLMSTSSWEILGFRILKEIQNVPVGTATEFYLVSMKFGFKNLNSFLKPQLFTLENILTLYKKASEKSNQILCQEIVNLSTKFTMLQLLDYSKSVPTDLFRDFIEEQEIAYIQQQEEKKRATDVVMEEYFFEDDACPMSDGEEQMEEDYCEEEEEEDEE